VIELPGGTILGPYETREEWLEARKLGIGGSDIGALLGLSQFKSPLQVFYEKTEGATQEVNEAMEIGAAIEPWILDRWYEDSGEPVGTYLYRGLVTIQSQTFPFLLHSPDALLCSQGPLTAFAGVEIKNIRSDAHWDPLPEFYMAQVQHGLLCSGLDRWIVVALVGGQKLITREIEPDKEMQGRIAFEAEKFWTSHVLANVPPEPDGSETDSNVLNRRWGASQDEIALLPDYCLQDLKTARRQLDASEKKMRKVEQTIKFRMGSKEHAVTESGEKLATWKVGTRTGVDVKRLREVSPEVAKKFEKTSPTRIFRPSL
jgi:putative phage-type endonuclease